MFTILGRLSLKMQGDGLILPSAVSQVNKTVANISCLKHRHVSKGHFQQFENVLSKSGDEGSLQGKEKHSGVGPSFSSKSTRLLIFVWTASKNVSACF